jgi:hypothetical protein
MASDSVERLGSAASAARPPAVTSHARGATDSSCSRVSADRLRSAPSVACPGCAASWSLVRPVSQASPLICSPLRPASGDAGATTSSCRPLREKSAVSWADAAGRPPRMCSDVRPSSSARAACGRGGGRGVFLGGGAGAAAGALSGGRGRWGWGARPLPGSAAVPCPPTPAARCAHDAALPVLVAGLVAEGQLQVAQVLEDEQQLDVLRQGGGADGGADHQLAAGLQLAALLQVPDLHHPVVHLRVHDQRHVVVLLLRRARRGRARRCWTGREHASAGPGLQPASLGEITRAPGLGEGLTILLRVPRPPSASRGAASRRGRLFGPAGGSAGGRCTNFESNLLRCRPRARGCEVIARNPAPEQNSCTTVAPHVVKSHRIVRVRVGAAY